MDDVFSNRQFNRKKQEITPKTLTTRTQISFLVTKSVWSVNQAKLKIHLLPTHKTHLWKFLNECVWYVFIRLWRIDMSFQETTNKIKIRIRTKDIKINHLDGIDGILIVFYTLLYNIWILLSYLVLSIFGILNRSYIFF